MFELVMEWLSFQREWETACWCRLFRGGGQSGLSEKREGSITLLMLVLNAEELLALCEPETDEVADFFLEAMHGLEFSDDRSGFLEF